jgi:hypothetical protein
MSLQAGIRRRGHAVSFAWESNLFGYAFNLFEEVRRELNLPNLHEFASDEEGSEFDLDDDEIDRMEEQLPEEEEEFAADMLIRELGAWHDPVHVASVVATYREYFEAQPADREFALKRWSCKAGDIALDLGNLETELASSGTPFRIVVG